MAFGARAAAAAALLGALTLGAPAMAQPPASTSLPLGPREEQRRTVLYKEGFDAASAGRWAEAKERFAAALTIRASAKVLFSLAQAEEQLGELGSASRDYNQAQETARAAGERDVLAAAASAGAVLDPRVPRVRIVVRGAGPAAPATATIDGEAAPVGTLVAVNPGGHHVVVTAPGMREVQATVAVGERQQLDVPVSLEAATASPASGDVRFPASAPPRPAPGSGEDARTTQRTIAWVAIGVGAASLVGAAVSFAIRQSAVHDAQSICQGPGLTMCPENDDALESDASRGRAASTLVTVLGILGAASVTGGIVLFVTSRGQSQKSRFSISPTVRGASAAWRF